MNPFDILVAALSAYCLVRGVFRGLIREVASLVGVLGGFWCAYSFYDTGGRWLSGWVAIPRCATWSPSWPSSAGSSWR